ncbi:hypothetical protein ACQP1W_52480 (plasmid) [Spirillospora sp. CA-255316]
MAAWRHYSAWRDWSRWRDQPADRRRHTYTMIVALYPSSSALASDWRRLWDSPCSGTAEHYQRDRGEVAGWEFARRVQIGTCPGGVCTVVIDYLRRGGQIAVAALGEGGTPERGPVLDRADRYREMLARRLAGPVTEPARP